MSILPSPFTSTKVDFVFLCRRPAGGQESARGRIYARFGHGKLDEAGHFLEPYMGQAQAGIGGPYDILADVLKRNDRELAFDRLEKSYRHHDGWLLFINVNPEMDSVF